MLNYNNLPDNDLYNLLKQDDEAAFSLLYSRFWKKLLFKAMLKLNSESDAEEVVQDTFIDLWNSRHRIEIKTTFHTYIAAIVRYKIMAKMAANKSILWEEKDFNKLHLTDNSTQDWISFNDLRNDIEKAISTLPEKCQIVFRLSREKALSDKQIAEKLQISKKTVEAHISRALKHIRTSINSLLFISI